MLLVADVGNTNITLGIYPLPRTPGRLPSGKAPRRSSVPVDPAAVWRLPTRRDATADELGAAFLALLRAKGHDPAGLRGAAVASVVPALDAPLAEALQEYLRVRPLFVAPGLDTGIKNLYRRPEDVGADRIVNAVAAYALTGAPCVVADFGTATTFDVVGRGGTYQGGVITPGPRMAAEALARGTAKLPRLEVFHRPPQVLGRSTQDSLASGLFWGYVGLTREILSRLTREMGGKPSVLATGGLAALLSPHIPAIQRVLPHLTLEGLRLIWLRNQ